MDKTLVALDLETTGLSPRLDRVIEVGAIRFRDGRVLDTFQSLVRPEVPIPPAVKHLTGITDEDVAGAPHPDEILAKLADFVGDDPVVAHSGNFDVSFLGARPLAEEYELFDTLDLARILLPMAPSHSLPHLSRQLELTHSRPHRALSDADAARQLFDFLWRFSRGLPAELLERMLEVTQGWSHPIRHFIEDAKLAGPDGMSSFKAPAATLKQPPRGGSPSTDPKSIGALLGPEGPMAASLPDYELREPQLQMALAVAQLFSRGGRLLVEAGPGTGKSLADRKSVV